jgi:hypothetical protein
VTIVALQTVLVANGARSRKTGRPVAGAPSLVEIKAAQLLRSCGLSIKAVAFDMGRSKSWVSQWTRGPQRRRGAYD